VINVAGGRQGNHPCGHERVLRARFADAQFFWASDQKRRLADYLPKLERITYESRLGSYRDKVERVRSIARWLTEQWFNLGMLQAHVAEADRAAELAKCDLATEMVREFPELQGIVGGLYARAQGEPWSCRRRLRPLSPRGLTIPSPQSHGLRRGSRGQTRFRGGLLRLGVVPHGLERSLRAAPRRARHREDHSRQETPPFDSLSIGAAAKALVTLKPKRGVTPAQETQILDFIHDRAKFVFREREGFGYDEVSAVFRAGADDLVDAQKAARGPESHPANPRTSSRLRFPLRHPQNSGEGDVPAGAGHHVNSDLFESPAERDLYSAVRDAASKSSGPEARRESIRKRLKSSPACAKPWTSSSMGSW